MINAIVEHKGQTANIELPYDTVGIALELRAIGVNNSPRAVTLTDEKNDIYVKLESESDFGKHIIPLFTEQNTLCDVNALCYALKNCRDEIKENLEQDILNDQYNASYELLNDVRKRTEACGIIKQSFYCPLEGSIEDDEYGGQQWVGNEFLRFNEYAIRELLENEQACLEDEMAQFFNEDDNIKEKLVSAVWNVDEYDGKLYGKINCSFTEELTEKEMETFKDWLVGQCSDGFGEHFEQQPIETEEGDLFVSFWNFSDNYFLCSEDELDDHINETQGMQIGGM